MSRVEISTVAKNYAQALFELDMDKTAIKTELCEVLNTIESCSDLQIVLSNSSISYKKRIEIIEEIFAKKINSGLLNLLKLLIEKGRISELCGIYEAFCELDNRVSNKKSVQIVSSIELDEETKQRIIQKLTDKLKYEVLPDWQIDKSIIAGLVFKYDDYVIDTSVLAKLKQLSKQ